MIGKKLTLLATALLISLPNAVLAEDVDVRAGSVRINTTDSGGVSVDTGRHGVQIDSNSNTRANKLKKKRYCVKQRYSHRYRCYYKTKYQSNSSRRPKVYSNTSTVETPMYDRSFRRVRSDSNYHCRGDSTYSHQEITQSRDSDELYVENSISTSGCD